MYYIISDEFEKKLNDNNFFKKLNLKLYKSDFSKSKNLINSIVIVKYNNLYNTFIQEILKQDNILIIFYDYIKELPNNFIKNKNIVIVNTKLLENENFYPLFTSLLQCLESKIQSIEELNDKIFDLALASTNVLEEKEKMEEQAIRDGLTGLYNHAFFRESLNKIFHDAKKHNKPFSLIIIDIDFFKKVNDTYGHLAGDLVLKEFANLIKNNTRKTDIVARYGGEEFSIILKNSSYENTIKYLDNLMQLISNYNFKFNNLSLHITFSAGFTIFNSNFENPNTMLEKADKALYISKNNGRNRYTYLE